MWKGLAHPGQCCLWEGGPRGVYKSRLSKPVSIIPPWPLLQSLIPSSCLGLLPWLPSGWTTIATWSKSFLVHVVLVMMIITATESKLRYYFVPTLCSPAMGVFPSVNSAQQFLRLSGMYNRLLIVRKSRNWLKVNCVGTPANLWLKFLWCRDSH